VTPRPTGDGLHQRLRFAVPSEQLWLALGDPALIASCVPGVRLTSVEGETIVGEMVVALGPVRTRFGGEATLSYDDVAHSGVVRGGGNDQMSGTRLAASAEFRVRDDAAGSMLEVDVDYTLRGALAQLAKPHVVDLLAGEIAALFASNLAARLRGEQAVAPRPLPGALLVAKLAWSWLVGRFKRDG
jgi:carbon monoxide dehydrogenase subunit G